MLPRAARVVRLAALVPLCALLVGGCKKKAPPPAPPPPLQRWKAPALPPLPPIFCPAPEAFAAFLTDPGPAAPVAPPALKEIPGKSGKPGKPGKPGTKPAVAIKPAPKPPVGKHAGKPEPRALRTDCVVFAPGRFWLAIALSYDEKTGKNPRLGLISGSPQGRSMVFDITPAPVEAIEKLLQENREIGVRVRKTRDDQSLVRLGVTGGPGGGRPESREVGILLQLAAHRPPNILWEGPGDQVVALPGGCIAEQTIDFELLFRTRLEQFSMARIRPDATGKIPAGCKADPSMQDSLNFRPVPLPPGRILGEATP